jgi:hypothetical protein
MSSITSRISWSFPYGAPTDVTLPNSYAYNTTRYTIEDYLSNYQIDTDAPSYMHGKDIIQSSWSGIDTVAGLSLGLYCLACAVQGDERSHACLGSSQTGFTEIWSDVGIANEGTGLEVDMPTGTDGREVGDNWNYIRDRDFACVFQMQQDGQEGGTSLSDVMLSMGDVNPSPNFYNATYRTGHPKNLIDAEESKSLETGPLTFTFPGPGNLTGLNSDADMTTYLEHALHDPNTQYWGDASSLATMPEAEDLIEASWSANPNMDISNIEPISMELTCFVCLAPYNTDDNNNNNIPSSYCNNWANSHSNEDFTENTADNITETKTLKNSLPHDNTTTSLEIPTLPPSFFNDPPEFHKQPDTMLYACALALALVSGSNLPPTSISTSYNDNIQEQTVYSQVFFATQRKGRHTREQYVFWAKNPSGVPSGRQRAREEEEQDEAEAKEQVNQNNANPGTKAGIAIGVVVGVGMLGYLVWVGWRKRRSGAEMVGREEGGEVSEVGGAEQKV